MDNKIVKIMLCSVLAFSFSVNAGSYTGLIKQLQVEGIGEAHNTLYIDLDITDSPCASTNSLNRLTLKNNAQQSAAMAALIANKVVTLHTQGVCSSTIEEINYIMLYSHQ